MDNIRVVYSKFIEQLNLQMEREIEIVKRFYRQISIQEGIKKLEVPIFSPGAGVEKLVEKIR